MTGPGLISLFCFLMTAAHFLRGGMHAGVILCMGLAALSFSRRGWLRRSVTFLLLASLLFWGAETWHLARLRMMEGLPFLASPENAEYMKAKAMRRLLDEAEKGWKSAEKDGWVSEEDAYRALGVTE